MSAGEFFTGTQLMPGVLLTHHIDLVHVRFTPPRRALSSAVLNGGYCQASDFLNVRVAKHSDRLMEDPAMTLQRIGAQRGCGVVIVGMMTAASMASLRVVREPISSETLAVLVTVGLDNARRAGDPAEYRALEVVPTQLGTINVAIVTSALVTDEALVEMVAVATEAKVAALHELQVRSPVSGQLATGTGTDAIAIFTGHGQQRVRFAGKHTLLGERLAVMVMQAIRGSINCQQVSLG